MAGKIRKLLVANRGEIALRVMRTAREMGIQTVAVYSEADRNALHVRFADEAYCIGPPSSSQSYLLMDKIISVAKSSQADSIHPGYGFLSENAVFAARVQEAGLIFVGPDPKSIEMMGDKLSAKQAARKFDIPMLPGSAAAIKDLAEAQRVIAETGYPVLIKASAGGGGKGMRVVESEQELAEQLSRAKSEALSAFGDDSVFIEKYIASPRHIEIQVLADQMGNTIHLFERECSIQRRHQKLVEEAPSCIITDAVRKRMGDDAVRIAKACNYTGAGTVEFLVEYDQVTKQLHYYFLEMNTRLQVEHPVTECITGIDLVREQICVAQGEELHYAQDDLAIRGHAIELRVTAEDPRNNFLPDTGILRVYNRPQGNGVRVDDGYEQGMEIPVYYDPLLSKLIVYAEDRDTACRKMIRAIEEYRITGVETTLPFGRFVMEHEAFTSGLFDTRFIEKYFDPAKLDTMDAEEEKAAAVFASAYASKNGGRAETEEGAQSVKPSAWKRRRS